MSPILHHRKDGASPFTRFHFKSTPGLESVSMRGRWLHNGLRFLLGMILRYVLRSEMLRFTLAVVGASSWCSDGLEWDFFRLGFSSRGPSVSFPT